MTRRTTHKTYEIHLKGHLPPELMGRFGDATEIEAPAETILLTQAIDQRGLDDLIARLEGLGLELLELRRSARRDPGAEQRSP